jgi:hypothetical protein
MPVLHCDRCHHEWETCASKELARLAGCSWRGGGAYVLADDTPLERMVRDMALNPLAHEQTR